MTSDTPPTFAASQASVLRRAWNDVAATGAPQLPDLPALLDQRLSELEAGGRLDEPSLLAVAEETSQYALEHGAGEVARGLSKRLRRAIYEFLLALDAVNPAEMTNPVVLTSPPNVAVPPITEPRAPVAFTPADVPGADEPAAVQTPTAPMRLWEATALPTPAREVYRVATRDVQTLDNAAPAVTEAPAAEAVVDEPLVVADEMAAEPFTIEAEFDGVEAAADVAETRIAEAETVAAEYEEAAAPGDAHVEAPDAVDAPVGEAEVDAAEDVPVAEATTEWTPADDADASVEGPVAGTVDAEAPVELPEVEQPAPALAEALQPEPLAAETQPDLTPVDAAEAEGAPAEHEPESAHAEWLRPQAASAEAHPTPTGNGVKPPRDLLRVPRQFRRLPPLTGPSNNGGPSVSPELPAPEAPTPAAFIAPEPTPAPAPPAPTPLDDDLTGVPSVPWVFVAPAAPEEPAPTPEAEAEDEELGVPFSPFAFSGDQVAGPQAAATTDEADTTSAGISAEAPVPADAHTEAPAPLDAAAQPDEPDLPHPPALAEEPLYPPPGAPAANQLFIAPPPVSAQPLPWEPAPAPTAAGDPFPIAPREGFHLTDPEILEFQPDAPEEPEDNPFLTPAQPPAASTLPPLPAPPAASAPQASTPEAPAAPQPGDAHDDGVWRIRQSPRAQLLAERMAQKRREEAARVAFEAASIVNEPARGRRKKRGDEAPLDLPTARRQLDEHLRKKRGAEAGALLQRLAQGLGGREIADLALDAGDRCRALGQSRSATNCYLAAWRADPLYETPLWRLSDVCLNDQEIDLAVGYLERIAELMRSRSDDEGAIGVYRKIAMIAPERQDVRDVIRLAKTTGRLDG